MSEKPFWLAKGSEVVIYRDGPNAFVRTGTVERVYDRTVRVLDVNGTSYRFDIGSLSESSGGAWIQHYTKLSGPGDARALRIAARLKISNHLNTLERWLARQPREGLDEEAEKAVEELALLIPAYNKEK